MSGRRAASRRAGPGVAPLLLAVACLATAHGPAGAQAGTEGATSAEARLVFPARPGVCGAGDAILMREPDGTTLFLSGHSRHSRRGGDGAWRAGEPPCRTGDVVALLRREGGAVVDVSLEVVGRGDADARAGVAGARRLDGQEAADLLLAAVPTASGRSAEELVLAAALADGAEIWPALLRLGRDRSLPRRTRRSAIHWLGRQAATEAAEAVGGIVRDRTEEDGVREAAVFALSQLPGERAVPLLIEVVRTVEDARVRGRALFWLADSEDPRALALFEEILVARGR